jgi:hypothetical protein
MAGDRDMPAWETVVEKMESGFCIGIDAPGWRRSSRHSGSGTDVEHPHGEVAKSHLGNGEWGDRFISRLVDPAIGWIIENGFADASGKRRGRSDRERGTETGDAVRDETHVNRA